MAGISDIAKQAGVKEEQVKAIFDVIKKSTEPVQIRGFGSFSVKTRAARTGRNPQTGEALNIPAKNVLTFKASK